MNAEPVARLLLLCLLALVALAAPAARAAPTLAVEVSGIEGELLDNARAALAIAQQAGKPGLGAQQIRDLHSRAPDEIRLALQPFGYYQPTVEDRLREPPASDGLWRASYVIDPGPAVTVGDLDIQFTGASGDAQLAQLATGFALAKDTRLDHRRYEAAKRDLLQAVKELGYRDAAYTRHRVVVDVPASRADIALAIATGPRFYIGAITFEQERLDPAFLERFLVLHSGAPYNGAALAEQRRVLSRSGYFREVEILPLPGDPARPDTVDLRIRLADYPPNRFRGSLGWGTDTGFGAQLDWTRRYVGGRGQRFTASGAAVEERNKLAGDLNYIIPMDPLSGSQLEFSARHESKDLTYEDVGLPEGGETRIATNLVSAFWHSPPREWGAFSLETRSGISLVAEDYDVFEVLFGNLSNADQEFLIDLLGPQAYDTLTPDFEAVVGSVRLTARRADERLFIRDGDHFRLDLLGTDEALGSNIGFWQAALSTWHIRPLFDSDRVLVRTAIGYSEAKSDNVLLVDFNKMPEYYEFRAGGVHSIRGYGWEELVPDDAITGGKHQVIASVEYEHQVIPEWSVAVFVDGGNAFNDFDRIKPVYGAGIGVRWRSPVGMARIDLGIPLDDAEDSFQVYITVGPEF
ncbi:hypothetical protein E4634_09715 [Mangrovimicrobium sediminis]|uniref:Translocation and assembly module subunit TamA n=1 Tax=Mangrovimicrobium sediminis TaxID=2562682 RepID=A0A4Z0M201_9GAMM|nr:BamA/TamA family outer membrane protein [Haliea sp. SAOS-164]TGD73305.1 hypothetical protein E4634_09715 [Haliea sp. SAOS-164]